MSAPTTNYVQHGGYTEMYQPMSYQAESESSDDDYYDDGDEKASESNNAVALESNTNETPDFESISASEPDGYHDTDDQGTPSEADEYLDNNDPGTSSEADHYPDNYPETSSDPGDYSEHPFYGSKMILLEEGMLFLKFIYR